MHRPDRRVCSPDSLGHPQAEIWAVDGDQNIWLPYEHSIDGLCQQTSQPHVFRQYLCKPDNRKFRHIKQAVDALHLHLRTSHPLELNNRNGLL